MPRIRTIKPGFFTSPDMAALPIATQRTFIGLWVYADDSGRGVDDARLVKATVWPLDDGYTVKKVEKDLALLASRGHIVRYEADGRRYLQVTNWHHQKISHPTPSNYPPPEEGIVSPPESFRNPPEKLPGERKGRERKGFSPGAGKKWGEQARSLAATEWDRREVKPICGFPALCERVQEALDAGHPPERVEAALPRMSTFTRNSFDFELNGRTPRAAESETEAWLREMNQ